MSIYNKLNDREWLYCKYYTEKLSAKKISELVGCKTSNSVRQALIKFEIPIRSYREAQVIGRDDNLIIDEEILTGTLLGDGSLQKSCKSSTIAAPFYVKKCKWKDYSLHIGHKFSKNGKVNIKTENTFLKRKRWNVECEYYVIRTLSSTLLHSWYSKWYPLGKKIVPMDLVLTPKIILYWFLDDGYSTYRNRNKEYQKYGWTQQKNQVILGFCSESFTKQENEFLSNQLNTMGISTSVRPYNEGTGWRIFINQTSSNNFFDLIGECPVPSLQYKWKIT